jgi:hypothetical protein
MQRLASRIWSHDSRHHPGQLSWSAYYGEDLDLGPVELVRARGDLAGWAWAESDTWLEICVDPAHADVAPDLIGWFMEREKIEPCGGWYPSEVPGTLVTEVAAHDAALAHDPKQVATWIAEIVQG